MKRAEILDNAKKCVVGDREQDYGTPEHNFHAIANMWHTYLVSSCITFSEDGKTIDVRIRPHDVAAMMAIVKIARIGSGHAKEDNWIDLAGYAACGGELQR